MWRPRELSFGGGIGERAGSMESPIPPTARRLDLLFAAEGFEADLLPLWDNCIAFAAFFSLWRRSLSALRASICWRSSRVGCR